MILQALYEYYRRKSADAENADMAVSGWQWKEIPFVLVLDAAGKLAAVDDCRKGKKRARPFLVPQEVKRTVGIASNLLWDKPSYIWGYDPQGKPERLQKQRDAFVACILHLPQEDAGVKAAIAYLSDAEAALAQAQARPEWQAIAESAPFIALRLDGDEGNRLICERPAVKDALQNKTAEDAPQGVCLVTGNAAPIARLHAPIKGVPGAQSSGAPLVSFNDDAFRSYGKEQGDNAPVSEAAADAYTKALNHLLGKDSRQKFQCGGTTVVFWARRQGEALESGLAALLGFGDKDDPDYRTNAIHALLDSPHKGGGAELSAEDNFYLLGLSPNAARLSVRFWLPTTAAGVQDNLREFFEQIRLVAGKTLYPTLRSLLSSLALLYRLENLPPLLEGAVLQSIFSGAPFPQTLLATALRRMRAERMLPHLRAALIKAYLIRNCKKKIAMSLDETNPEPAYHLGRLFAVLEKTQEEAQPGINATIRDRFYGAASIRPASVFPILAKLHMHHLREIENGGRSVNLEKMAAGIFSKVSGFASLLTLEEQGLFAIGYYHQRQALFTKAETSEKQAA